MPKETPKDRLHGLLPDLLLCTAITLLGVAARAWRLADQSVWYDEWITLRALGASSLRECLRIDGELDWSMVPAYHILQYYWAKCVSSSDLGIRWLSMLFAILAFLVLYALARRLHGRWAAVTATLFLALTPFNIFHAQGIRNYSMALLAGLLAIYTFLRSVEPSETRSRNWWGGNLVANAFLLWTHLFGVFLFAAQGFYLLIYHRPERRLWLRWMAAHALLIVPVVILQLSNPGNANYPTVERPPLGRFYTLVQHHYTHPFDWVDYNLPPDNQYDVLSPIGAFLEARTESNDYTSLRMRGAGYLQQATLLLLIAYAVGSFVVARGRKSPWPGDTPLDERRRATLLAVWILVPAACLFVMAWVLRREVAFERYLSYAYPALYVAVGASVARLPRTAWRVVFLGVLVALLGLQALTIQYVPIRHDLAGAIKVFRQQATADDRIIAYGNNAEILFGYNLHEPTRQILRADGFEHFRKLLADEMNQRGHAWVMLYSTPPVKDSPMEESGLGERVMAECEAHGWPYTRNVFGGMLSVWIFRVGDEAARVANN